MSKGKKDIDGVLLVDKPEGLSSAALVAKVKNRLNAKKAGHSGTLDPFATGLMVICLGKATRLSNFFLNDNKSYVAEIELGKETDTQDVTGNVIESSDSFDISFEELKKTVLKFIGEQKQIPPVFSALKHKGVPLYKLAREGKAVEKPPRDINIYNINILDYDPPRVILEVSCSKGTYIRTLCTDIGRALGCYGYLKNLRRTESSGFFLSDAVVLDDVSEERIIDMADTLNDFDVVNVNNILAGKISNGVKLTSKDLPMEKGRFLKVLHDDKLIAVMERKEREYNYCCVFHH